jgi:hypothetical protein
LGNPQETMDMMNLRPRVAIGVRVYDGEARLPECLECLAV